MFYDEVPDPPAAPTQWAASYQGGAWEDGWRAGYAAANGIEQPDENGSDDGESAGEELR